MSWNLGMWRLELTTQQKIRTIELDGKTVKLQIVRTHIMSTDKC